MRIASESPWNLEDLGVDRGVRKWHASGMQKIQTLLVTSSAQESSPDSLTCPLRPHVIWPLPTCLTPSSATLSLASSDPTCQAYFSSLNVPRAVVQWPLLMLLFIYLFLAFFSLSLLQSLAGKHLLIPQVSAQNVASWDAYLDPSILNSGPCLFVLQHFLLFFHSFCHSSNNVLVYSFAQHLSFN